MYLQKHKYILYWLNITIFRFQMYGQYVKHLQEEVFLIIGHVHAKYCSIVEFAQNRNNCQILLFHTDRQQESYFEVDVGMIRIEYSCLLSQDVIYSCAI